MKASAIYVGEDKGAGGKLRKPLVRKKPSTPYDRPPQSKTVNQSENGWLSKLVDPAFRLISRSSTRLLPSFFSRSALTDDLPSSIDYDPGVLQNSHSLFFLSECYCGKLFELKLLTALLKITTHTPPSNPPPLPPSPTSLLLALPCFLFAPSVTVIVIGTLMASSGVPCLGHCFGYAFDVALFYILHYSELSLSVWYN